MTINYLLDLPAVSQPAVAQPSRKRPLVEEDEIIILPPDEKARQEKDH